MEKKLKDDFEKAVNAYLMAFCEKQGFGYEDAKESWVAGDVGSVVRCGDCYLSFDDIRTDIDMDAPAGEIINWYNYYEEMAILNLPLMNYNGWLQGMPRVDDDVIEMAKRFNEMNLQLHKEMDPIYKNFK